LATNHDENFGDTVAYYGTLNNDGGWVPVVRSMANRNQMELSIMGKDVGIESRASDHIWIAAVRDFSVTA